MKYKLIKPMNSNYNTIEQILTNRGIQYEDVYHYLNTTDKDINSFLLLGKDKLKKAASLLINTINKNEKALIVVDCDCDGYTSSAILINYLYDLFPSWINNNVKWFLHENKTHGLSDVMQYIYDNDFKLIVCPDASSNDYKCHEELYNKDINIIILDHHEVEIEPEYAICINNQICDYPNKFLSGAGIVWQFCRYLDSLLNINNADNYLDLTALGNCGDMMSLKSIETKHIITKGFKQDNIKNPFIYGIAEKNSYSLGEYITPVGAAFYIVPFINSMVRSGTLQEKEILFKSMLKFTAFDEILSNKRGHSLGEKEKLIDQALRTVTNVKNRQTREQDKGMEIIEKQIEEKNMMKHKILLFLLEPNQIDSNIAGLIANKIMAKYQRPVLMLTKVIKTNYVISNSNHEIAAYSGDSPEILSIEYQGSARGYSKSGVENFKDICQETNLVEYAEGHQNAFGISIKEENINKFLELTDEKLKDMESEPLYYVDYIFKGVDVKSDIILEIGNLKDLWGQDIDESYICIENLKITKDNLTLMSPDKKPTLKITIPNKKINLIKFSSSQEEYDSLCTTGYIELNIIGKCNNNEWMGNISPQIIIVDYEVIGQNKYIF